MTDTVALLTQYPFPTRVRYGDADQGTPPALALPDPQASMVPDGSVRAGGHVFTEGQAVAMLKMRGSDWTKAVLKHLRAFGRENCALEDYHALAKMGFAVNKGSRHVLTPSGRRRADMVAMDIARAEGMHAITYDLGNLHRAPASKCTCGWIAYRTRACPNWMIQLGRDAQHHLETVGEFVASEAAE